MSHITATHLTASHLGASQPSETSLPLACFAVAALGLEALVAGELATLAGEGLAVGAIEPGGVSFGADYGGLYAANLHLRLASRVLLRLGSFEARAFNQLERRGRRLPWGDILVPGQPVRFRVTSRKSRLYHQDAVAERLLRLSGGVAPSAGGEAGGDDGEESATQEFVVRLHRDQCTISADASGALLHRRGYRLATAKAPLRETLAAAILVGSGWDGAAPLLDPMCGSGTIPIEAARLARRMPPGVDRRFAFERWPSFEPERWRSLQEVARRQVLPRAPGPITGSDRDAGAIAAAVANAERAGVAGDITWRRAAISAIEPGAVPGWLVSNPPYGVRVGERARLRDLYAQLGNVARRHCPGWQVALLTANRELEGQLRLPLAARWESENGGLPVRLMQARVPERATGGTTR
jgi:putative N6-adenine-specific DNA methylase